MSNLSAPTVRQQFFIGGIHALILVTTTGHHFSTLRNMLPSASWAVFFLAGVFIRPIVAFVLLFALATFVDYAAIVWGGVSSFCVSPAYAALIPAYGVLWLGGRLYAARCGAQSLVLLPLAISVVAASILCELISSGSFYVFSGRFAEPSLAEFATRFAHYFPHSLPSMAFWVAAAAVIQVLVAVVNGKRGVSLRKP